MVRLTGRNGRITSTAMSRHLQKKFTVTFEIEAKNDLAEIESQAGIKGTLGSFQIGSKIPSLFKRRYRKTHYSSSRLSLSSQAPANASLERVAESLLKKLDVKRVQRMQVQLLDCKFFVRIGVFYTEYPPQVVLPLEIMRFATATGARLTVDYYQCSSMALSPQDRLARARLLRRLKRETGRA